MSYVLYGRPGSGSSCVEAALTLAGASVTLVDIPRAAMSPEMAALEAVNPLREMPTLVTPDGRIITESAAILLYLAEVFLDAGLAPPAGAPGRGDLYRWTVFLAANIYMSDLRRFYPERYTSDPAGAPAVKQAALTRLSREWDILVDGLGAGPFFLGAHRSVVDLYVTMFVSWRDDAGAALFAKSAALEALCQSVARDPALASVWARHEVVF